MFGLHVRNQLGAYLHDELSGRATKRVQAHLKRCKSCQQQLHKLEQAEEAAQSTPRLQPDEDLWPGIEARIMAYERDASAQPIRSHAVSASWMPKLSLGAVVAILLIVTWWWTQSGQQEEGDIWPQWRGRNQDGKAVAGDRVNYDGGIKLEVLWKKNLGSGYSSVSVADGQAVTMFSDSTFDYIAAFDAENGQELWRYEIAATYKGHNGSHDGPMSTPLLADGKVYAIGPRGGLLALDLQSGRKLWSTHLVRQLKAPQPFYGFATSPILDDDVLIVESGGQQGTISGFDKNNGELLWSTGDDSVKYHSPIRFRFAGQTQLVCASNNYLYGLEPRRGTVLWSFRHNGRGQTINPVVINHSRIFIRPSWEQTLLLELRRENRRYFAEKVWGKSTLKSSYDTPIAHAGHLFGFSSRLLKCVDANTGETVWKSPSPGDGFTMLVDEHLIIVTKQGTLHVVEASPEKYREVASLELFESPTWTPPSFANGRIYARSLGQIACVEIVEGAQAGPPTPGPDSGALKLAMLY